MKKLSGFTPLQINAINNNKYNGSAFSKNNRYGKHFLSVTGFTLLELLVVVVIVGILASLAIPKYIKATENSRAAEAYNNLNAIRQAEWAYYAKTNLFITGKNFSDLSIESPNDLNGAFEYEIYGIGGSTVPFNVQAKRKDGPYRRNIITMDANGNLDETNWLK